MKMLLFFFLLTGLFVSIYFFQKQSTHFNSAESKRVPHSDVFYKKLLSKVEQSKKVIGEKGFSKDYVFLIDMQLPSGKKRFFIYNLKKDTIEGTGLVAHGSCRATFAPTPHFSNTPETGCSSIGFYKVGFSYMGAFGKAFKLFGLDTSNANALKRHIVLHGYSCVPNKEVYPQAICNSLGCPMVSYRFLDQLTHIIEGSDKPILLCIYK